MGGENIVGDLLPTQPAEGRLTQLAFHVVAAVTLLDLDAAARVRAGTRYSANSRNRRLVLQGDTRSIRGTRVTALPRGLERVCLAMNKTEYGGTVTALQLVRVNALRGKRG